MLNINKNTLQARKDNSYCRTIKTEINKKNYDFHQHPVYSTISLLFQLSPALQNNSLPVTDTVKACLIATVGCMYMIEVPSPAI